MTDKPTQLSIRNLVEGRPWTSADVDFMRRNADSGALWIALQLGRSVGSVKACANRNRISLRRKGEARGLVLGQPRAESWRSLRDRGVSNPTRIRQSIIEGELSLEEVEDRLRAIASGREAKICPACGVRQVDRQSGWCTPCYTRELARAHRDATDRIEARRELDAARQGKSRARRAAEADDE